ncbi:MAG: outer membrane beta-barrel protein [Prevotella sp.]|nr:outer membrane beta-barrel protein [Prevotella sp.]
MKRTFIIALVLSVTTFAFAQTKRFQFEAGLNYPLSFETGGYKQSELGVYISGTYNFKESPLSVKLKMSRDNYSMVYPLFILGGEAYTIIPSLNYTIPLSKKATFYAGLGLGASYERVVIVEENQKEGSPWNFVAATQVGVHLFKHLNVSAHYNIINKHYSRLMLGVGYVF